MHDPNSVSQSQDTLSPAALDSSRVNFLSDKLLKLEDSSSSMALDDEIQGSFVHVSQPGPFNQESASDHVTQSKNKYGSLVESVPSAPRTSNIRVLSLPALESDGISPNIAVPLENPRITSMPCQVQVTSFTGSKSPNSTLEGSDRSLITTDSSDLSFDSHLSQLEPHGNAKAYPRIRRTSLSVTPSPPSSPESVVIVYQQSPLSNTFLRGPLHKDDEGTHRHTIYGRAMPKTSFPRLWSVSTKTYSCAPWAWQPTIREVPFVSN